MKEYTVMDVTPEAGLDRRTFLKYSGLAALGLSGLAFLPGCAVDPVTGQKQLMLMSREQEIAIDHQQSPFQFASDYGVTQDAGLNAYVADVGRAMTAHVHRKDMPYNFQCVNATYINAYAFPGGSIAVTRGILLELGNEAELAALLGHELGHVNARHSAEQASKGQLSSLLIGGLAILASTQGSGLGDLTQQLGSLGQGLFLSKYSRDNEREADYLGHQYMTASHYSSKGFVGLMEMLNAMNKAQPSAAQMLFTTHPMSSERLTAAVQRDLGQYRNTHAFPMNRDRYMDRTASLRRKKAAIQQMQEGERYLAKEEYGKAENAFKTALKSADRDYTGHVLMAKCLLIQKKPEQALPHANAATALYPKEIQGHYISGLANLGVKKPDHAFQSFSQCDRLLSGNPQVTFYKGYSQDRSGRQKEAAQLYTTYLKQVNNASNKYTQYAYSRLKTWGYVH